MYYGFFPNIKTKNDSGNSGLTKLNYQPIDATNLKRYIFRNFGFMVISQSSKS